MESAWDTIQTSIGPLRIKACARDYFNLKNPEAEGSFLFATIKRSGDSWEIDPLWGSRYETPESPDDLREELLRLGVEWAEAHTEDFERAGDEEFKSIVEGTVDFVLTEVVVELNAALKDVTANLKDEPEFRRQASPALRRKYQDAARMLREMRSQVKVMMKSITKAASLSAEEMV
jgi:hypothetical protein